MDLIKPNNELEKAGKLDSNREQIEQYLAAGGEGVILTEKQQELLTRWTFTDDIIRQNVGKLSRGEIANIISKRFGVALCTAKADMTAAEAVFSSSNPLNKKHRIQIRIEFLEKQINAAALKGDFMEVAQMEKVLAKYLEIYPDITPNQSPKTIIYNVNAGKITEMLIPTEDAEFEIENALKKIENG